ncbi:MAG: L-lactate permease, partial [Acidimicrobiales bacterium]
MIAFIQTLEPVGGVAGSTLLALVPVVLLLALLAGLRLPAWKAVIVGAVVTVAMGILIWHAPPAKEARAWLYGAFTGIWAIDWITFWGVVIYNTLVVTGVFEDFKRWLILQATEDVRVQAVLLAWSLGALLEGLVGFGYPWAVVAPILIALGVVELDAIRVAAIANNAPVSFGALGVPIIVLAAVTGLPLMALSASVGKIVAVLALLPPFILIVLVTGKKGLKDGWPLAVVGSLGFIAGQFPTSQFLGPYLPDVMGALVSFAALLVLLHFWRPRTILGYGGVPVAQAQMATAGRPGTAPRLSSHAAPPLSRRQVSRLFLPFVVLIVVVLAITGPWSTLPAIKLFALHVGAVSSLSHKAVLVAFEFTPFIGGTAILISWLVIVALLKASGSQVKTALSTSWSQMWGAVLVGPFIFGLAEAFNYAGMANSLAEGFSKLGPAFIVVAPVIGFIGVALSGSNTATNAIFGAFQLSVGRLLHFPLLLAPSLNSVGSEVGKPVAPQTASVGVSTSKYV